MRALEGDPAAGAWFRRAWAGEVSLIAPDHLVIEVANVLARGIRAGRATVGDAGSALARLGRTVRMIPAPMLGVDVFELALERDLSAYDALYAVLAERLDAVLVTADRKLAAAVPRSELLDG